MHGDACVLKDLRRRGGQLVDPSDVCGCIPSALHVSDLVPLLTAPFSGRFVQDALCPVSTDYVFLSSRGERTHVYTSGSKSLTFELGSYRT